MRVTATDSVRGAATPKGSRDVHLLAAKMVWCRAINLDLARAKKNLALDRVDQLIKIYAIAH